MDWPCFWLSPHTLHSWSPPTSPHTCTALPSSQPCITLVQGAALPPRNTCPIPQRGKGVPPICRPPTQQSRSTQLPGPSHRQEYSSDTTQKWAPGPFTDLPPNPQPCVPAPRPVAGRGRSLQHWDTASTRPSTFSAREQAAFFPARSQPCPKHLSETPHPSKEGREFGRAALLSQLQPLSADLTPTLLQLHAIRVPLPCGCCSAAGEGDGMWSDSPASLCPRSPRAHRCRPCHPMLSQSS